MGRVLLSKHGGCDLEEYKGNHQGNSFHLGAAVLLNVESRMSCKKWSTVSRLACKRIPYSGVLSVDSDAWDTYAGYNGKLGVLLPHQ